MTPNLILAVRNAASSGSSAYDIYDFTGVPTVVPVLIVMQAGSPGAAAQAGQLATELQTVLLGSGPTAACTRRVEVASEPTQLCAFHEPLRQKLLVLVIDGVTPLSDEIWFAPWLKRHPDRSVLTIFPSDASPSRLLPNAGLNALNAQFWKSSVTEAVPAVLSRSGLTLEDQRVFLSYRRLEAHPLAEQLFDALAHEGLDVFLDRFNIRPGLNFQQRLTQELADKSMVLLIESAHIEESVWTEHEIQFTKRHQLGLLALKLPDRQASLPSIDADQRIELKKENFKKSDPELVANPEFGTGSANPPTYAQWGRLQDDVMREVVLAVKAVHDQALFRRRRFFRSNVEASLCHAGLQHSPVGSDGLIRVRSAGVDYALWLTTRPPELVDFHTAHSRLTPPHGTKGVVIGPTAAFEPGRLDKLTWLKTLCAMACIDEDDVPAAGSLIKAGKL